MLKERIYTGLVLAALFLVMTFALDTPYVAVCLFVVICIACLEWCKLACLKPLERVLFFSAVSGCCAAVYFYEAQLALNKWLLWVSLLWWSGISVVVLRYKQVDVDHNDSVIRLSKAMMGLMVLVPAYWSLVQLHDYHSHGVTFFLYAFFLVWAADVGAYFTGKKFGKRKLLPQVSPGKTLEGFAGGLACVALLAMGFGLFLDLGGKTYAMFILLSISIGLFSVFGDLFESLMKRQAGLKDSGNILPGHGGVLDRIDSVLAAAPLLLLSISAIIKL